MATKIRQGFVDQEMSALAKAEEFGPLSFQTEEAFKAKQEFRKNVMVGVANSQTDAKWWIDRSGMPVGEVFKMTPEQYAAFRKIGK